MGPATMDPAALRAACSIQLRLCSSGRSLLSPPADPSAFGCVWPSCIDAHCEHHPHRPILSWLADQNPELTWMFGCEQLFSMLDTISAMPVQRSLVAGWERSPQ
jgi:hypothetical protein